MKILDWFFPRQLAAYWEKIWEARAEIERTAREVRKVARQANTMLVENHLSERLVLAFELKEDER